MRPNDVKGGPLVPHGVTAVVVATLVCVFAGVVPSSFSSASAVTDCPDKWNIPSPTLTISKALASSDGLPVSLYTSNLFGADDSSKSMRGTIKPLSGLDPRTREDDRFEYALKFVFPEVYERLVTLGRDAYWKSGYEIVGGPEGFHHDPENRGWLRFQVPVQPWALNYSGIGSGSQLQWKLTIGVRGCPEYTVRSSKFTFGEVEPAEISMDDYFERFGNKLEEPINFKQEEDIRRVLSGNIELLKNAKVGEVVQTTTVRSQTGIAYFNWMLVGLKPSGCLDSVNPNAIPAIDPPRVRLNSLPCEFGLLFGVTLTELFDCRSSTCGMSVEYQSTLSEVRRNWYGGNYLRGDRVIVQRTLLPARLPDPAQTPPPPSASSVSTSRPPTASALKTIKCVKGRKVRQIVAKKPKCPSGYVLVRSRR